MKVLDKGEIKLLEVMGNDATICQSARVSTGKQNKKTNNEGLIRYMMRQGHWSPFEMVEFRFYVKAPIFVFRQWHRHRTANINELSGRAKEFDGEFYIPNKVYKQSEDNKQGTSDEESITKIDFETVYNGGYSLYKEMVNKGVAKETARIVLSNSLYSEMYWKCDLRNIFNFLKQRLDKHAQYETRQYAEAMAEMVKRHVPLSYAAFSDYIMNSIVLSSQEILFIASKGDGNFILSEREKKELNDKLSLLGLHELRNILQTV